MPVTGQGTNDAMTPESIQAMIDRAIQRNATQTQDDDSQNLGGGIRRPVQPTRMESVFHISGCAIENQVKFATCTLLGVALTLWNGHDAVYAMTWEMFKKKLTDKYCPNGEIKKLEIELPKTLDFAIELANDLMDQKLRTYAERSDCPVLKNQEEGNIILQVLAKVGTVAYKLELPQQLSQVHNTFHVSNLKKGLSDESLVIPLEELRVDDKLHFVEEPVEVMDRETKQLKRSRIPIIKVRWNSKRGPEFTWERKDQFKQKYPHLFTKTAPSSSATS
ncbi:hypothetical protein Tco_1138831 [Tanacetum coccineum]